jgi:hypothetical protein
MNSIPGCLHAFDLMTKNNSNPLMRRFAFTCECGKFGPWRRDRDSAYEDGLYHQDNEA